MARTLSLGVLILLIPALLMISGCGQPPVSDATATGATNSPPDAVTGDQASNDAISGQTPGTGSVDGSGGGQTGTVVEQIPVDSYGNPVNDGTIVPPRPPAELSYPVVTAIAVDPAGMVAAGDGIIAFGKNPGAAYMRLGETTATTIQGNWYNDAVYCVGKRVILVAKTSGGPNIVHVFDTRTGVLTPVVNTDVYEVGLGAPAEQDNIVADNNLVAILHRSATGKVLKVIDVSGPVPAVTTFTAALINPGQLAVDSLRAQVAVMEDDRYITVFPSGGPADVSPQRTDLHGNPAIASHPHIKIGNGKVIFQALSSNSVYLLDIATATKTLLPLSGTVNKTMNCLLKNGRFAYFLDREGESGDASPTFGNRLVFGPTKEPGALQIGSGAVIGNNQGQSGFGFTTAVLADGSTICLAGRMCSCAGGIARYSVLQVSTGAEFKPLTPADSSLIMATDLTSSNDLIVFKVENPTGGAWLGYIQWH